MSTANEFLHRQDDRRSAGLALNSPASSAPLLQPGAAPPADYYRNNLLRVLRFVRAEHPDLLMPVDLGFMASVEGRGASAQRLFARLIGRKGPLLRLDRIDYPEVRSLPAALDELLAAGLIEMEPDAPAETLLALLTRAELQGIGAAPGEAAGHAQGASPSCTKTALVADFARRWPKPCIRARVRRVSPWLAVLGRPSLQLAQLLFFGDSRRDLSLFVLEDLGWVRYENYRLCGEGRLFKDRREVDAYLRARLLRELALRLDERPSIARPLAKALRQRPAVPSRLEEQTLSRALNRLGRWFERRGAPDEALACYAASSVPPARERRVRLLCKMGRRAAAADQLRLVRRNPGNPQEADFAARFSLQTGRVAGRPRAASGRCPSALEKGAKRTGRHGVEETLAASAPPADERIEGFAMRLLTEGGGEAWHLENRLPQGLAALAFWEVLFAPVPGAFLNPYQDAPVDLYWDDFAAQRKDLIAAQKKRLADPEEFGRILHATFAAKAGVANALMSWRHFDRRLLQGLLEAVPHAQLLRLAGHLIENLGALRTGFPDLLVLRGRRNYEFVEVKGPGDSLRPAQRLWLDYLGRNGFNARVLRFRWP